MQMDEAQFTLRFSGESTSYLKIMIYNLQDNHQFIKQSAWL